MLTNNHSGAHAAAPAGGPNTVHKALSIFDWDAAPANIKTHDQEYLVQCPQCPPDRRTLSARSMSNNFRCTYRDTETYSKHYAGPPSPRQPCPIPGCQHPLFVATKDIPDHLLSIHGMERAGICTNVTDLRRVKLPQLLERLAAEAKALNEINWRIREVETRLSTRGEGVSKHGLNAIRVWSETDPRVGDEAQSEIARLKAADSGLTDVLNLFMAKVLVEVRLETDEVVCIQGGGPGGYAGVTKELERLGGGVANAFPHADDYMGRT